MCQVLKNTTTLISLAKPDPKLPIIEAELKLSAYVAKSNVALSISDTLIPSIKGISA